MPSRACTTASSRVIASTPPWQEELSSHAQEAFDRANAAYLGSSVFGRQISSVSSRI
jgi:hypothetical protein